MNAFDCWITPPCAAIVIREYLAPRIRGARVLDPFGGPGFLAQIVSPTCSVIEMDARWEPVLREQGVDHRIGDAFDDGDWPRADVATNPPYGRTQDAVAELQCHSYAHRVYSCALLRAEWWQHHGRRQYLPDEMLLLTWRPGFGYSARTGKWGTDSQGYAWCIWHPVPTGECRVRWVDRPEVPAALVAEQKRLARIAYEWGKREREEAA